MLASAATVEVVAKTLKEYEVKAIVVDPVRHEVTTTGIPCVPRRTHGVHR